MVEKHSKFEKKFIACYDENSDAIFRYCYFRLFNRERAREMMQDAFMKSWEYMAKGNQVDNLKAFVYKTATNLIIDEVRKNKKESSLDELHDIGFEPENKENKEKIERDTDSHTLESMMQNLEPAYRDVLIMRYVNGLRPKDIASICKESENVISVRINRAVKQLRVLLKISDKNSI